MTAHLRRAHRRTPTNNTTSSSAATAQAAIVLRLAERVACLAGSDPAVLGRVRALIDVAEAHGWGEPTAGTLATRELDWLPLQMHLGATRAWAGRRVRATAPQELLRLLIADGVGAPAPDDPAGVAGSAPAA